MIVWCVEDMMVSTQSEVSQQLLQLEDNAIAAQREIEAKWDKMSQSQELYDQAQSNHSEKAVLVVECQQRKEKATAECEKCDENLLAQTCKTEELAPPVRAKEAQIADVEKREAEAKAAAKEMTEMLQKANKDLAALKKKLEEGVATQEEVTEAEDSKKAGAQELAAQTKASDAAKKELKKVTNEGKKIRRDYDKQMTLLKKISELSVAATESKLAAEEDLKMAIKVQQTAAEAIEFQRKRQYVLRAQGDKRYEEQRKDQCEKDLLKVQQAFDKELREKAIVCKYDGFFSPEAPVLMISGPQTDDLIVASENHAFVRLFY